MNLDVPMTPAATGRCSDRCACADRSCVPHRRTSRHPSSRWPAWPCDRRGRRREGKPRYRHVGIGDRLILSTPAAVAESKRLNRSFNKSTVSPAGRPSASIVKFTISANSTVTSANWSAMLFSPLFRRSAIGPGRMFSRSASFSRFFVHLPSFAGWSRPSD